MSALCNCGHAWSYHDSYSPFHQQHYGRCHYGDCLCVAPSPTERDATAMTDNLTPADLARFIHPVPVGATIPGGTEWVNRETPAMFTGPHVRRNDFQSGPNTPRWTAEPIEPPKPALPTTPGTLVRDGHGRYWLRDDVGDWWSTDPRVNPDREGIADWTVVYDPTAPKPDPLDENDHRDRIDRCDHRIVRHGNKHWHTEMTTCPGYCSDKSLADWAAVCGPLRFADEVAS